MPIIALYIHKWENTGKDLGVTSCKDLPCWMCSNEASSDLPSLPS